MKAKHCLWLVGLFWFVAAEAGEELRFTCDPDRWVIELHLPKYVNYEQAPFGELYVGSRVDWGGTLPSDTGEPRPPLVLECRVNSRSYSFQISPYWEGELEGDFIHGKQFLPAVEISSEGKILLERTVLGTCVHGEENCPNGWAVSILLGRFSQDPIVSVRRQYIEMISP